MTKRIAEPAAMVAGRRLVSVAVAGPDGFAVSYSRHAEKAQAAIDVVLAHARFMTRQRAWPRGPYQLTASDGSTQSVRLP